MVFIDVADVIFCVVVKFVIFVFAVILLFNTSSQASPSIDVIVPPV